MTRLPEEVHSNKAFGWAAKDSSGVLSPFNFFTSLTGMAFFVFSMTFVADVSIDGSPLPCLVVGSFGRSGGALPMMVGFNFLDSCILETGEKDVTFKVLYCGICHSDLHMVKNEWGNSIYPLVPGHEIVGEVTEIGCKVQKFKVGDRVGVGCMVGSCHSCDNCINNLENYCAKMIFTYGTKYHDGAVTHGGYSNTMVVDEHFVVSIPENLPVDATAPLLCAGITVYSPLRFYGLDKPGLRVGVVGLGGLGHLAVKFAKAMGTNVTVISTSPSKQKEALENLGADSFLVSRDQDQLQAAIGTLDGIIDTVSAQHPLLPLLGLLKSHGKLVILGIPGKPFELQVFPLIQGRKLIGGSMIGGMKETQEMIDFAAEHNIKTDIEVIAMDYVNTAMDRLLKGDVKYRFVIDIGNTLRTSS
ncbi:hypothetical protein CXB51_008600 [Gossypium anomalum]|uniref:Enoyl reductase (ER) domain-containing protein n=1 Tax=Gossypium anomalum TaxID=47600 RepID=A0A8J6DAP4_9ROSI|nr:hypothetical protein CXB51_008600 [Gossypium anomalum]